jgi:uncharacterized membrane protein
LLRLRDFLTQSCAKALLSENVAGTAAKALPAASTHHSRGDKGREKKKEKCHGQKAAGQKNKNVCQEVEPEKRYDLTHAVQLLA